MELPDELLFEDWRSGHPREGRMVSRTQVPGLYEPADKTGSVMFTWNDGGDPVMIVGVGPDWSVATLMIDQKWYGYVASDAEGFTPIDLNGQTRQWPRAELLSRAAALPVLMTVPDLTAIKRGFPWRSQWRDVEPEPTPDITAW
jgi:hypothetical protein